MSGFVPSSAASNQVEKCLLAFYLNARSLKSEDFAMLRHVWSTWSCVAVVAAGSALESLATGQWSGGQSLPPACNVNPKMTNCGGDPESCAVTVNEVCGPLPCGTELAAAGETIPCPQGGAACFEQPWRSANLASTNPHCK